MKKAAFVVGVGLAGLGAALVAPATVGDSRFTVPFVPVSVTVPPDSATKPA